MKSKVIIYIYRLGRIIIALIFIWAGWSKLTDPQSFANTISAYGLVPQGMLGVIAIGLPALEVLLGLGILIDAPLSLEGITAMLMAFIAILWFGILKDISVDCGCFSANELKSQKSLRVALYRDYIFVGINMFLFAARYKLKGSIFLPVDTRFHFWKK